MEWKYPYIKRALKDNERNALLYFVFAIIFFCMSLFLICFHSALARFQLLGLAVILSAGWGVLCLMRAFNHLKQEGF